MASDRLSAPHPAADRPTLGRKCPMIGTRVTREDQDRVRRAAQGQPGGVAGYLRSLVLADLDKRDADAVT